MFPLKFIYLKHFPEMNSTTLQNYNETLTSAKHSSKNLSSEPTNASTLEAVMALKSIFAFKVCKHCIIKHLLAFAACFQLEAFQLQAKASALQLKSD